MKTENNALLKKSVYNLTVPFDGFNVIYNTLQDSLTLVKSSTVMSLKETDIALLHRQGVYVNSDIDERLVFRYRAAKQKFHPTRLHLFLTLTGDCNCDCEYCFAKGSFPNRSMTTEDIPFILNFAESLVSKREISEMHVDFFGGEPFLCEKFYLQVMREITKLGTRYGIVPFFQFYTNGTIMPRYGYEVFDEFEHVKFLITLDGLKDVHDTLRPLKNKKSSYEVILQNLKKIRDAQQQAVIRINYGKKGYTKVPFLLDELKIQELTCFPIEFYPIQNMSSSSADYEDAVGISDLPKINEYLWKEAVDRNIPISIRPVAANCYCSAFTDTMFVIDPDLDIYKCALLQCEKKYSIGNLKKQTKYLTDSVFYDWITYDPSLEEHCKECISLPVCAGGCGGSGTFRHGTHHHSNCYELSPNMLLRTMKTYVSVFYSDQVKLFCDGEKQVSILEPARYNEP